MAITSLATKADEGMWVLHKMDSRTHQVMQQLGLKLSPQELYDTQSGTSLKDAVVDFGDFCSGVVVSRDGLVFTNHHCGFGAIQALSTTGDDILKNGFVARNHAEERPAEGLSVFFLQQTDDVTETVKARLQEAAKAQPELTRQELASRLTNEVMDSLQAEYKTMYPNREVRVQSFCGGSQFYVSIYKEYKDIRLVFTPTQTLGKFGGDTDNWMWPRQTCDFSVFRVYADKNGEPAEYSPENVPLHPKRWARISLDGYAPGDYCMTIGFPGSTNRYLSSYGITERMEQQNAPRIEVRGMKQEVWNRWMKKERAIGIKYASKYAGSSNYWKNSIGMNKALKELNVVREKEQLEERIGRWVGQDKERQERFGGRLDSVRLAYGKRQELMRNVMYLGEIYSGFEIFTLARLADRLSLCEDSTAMAQGVKDYEEFMKDYDVRVDEETTATLLQLLTERVDTAWQPEFCKVIKKQFNGDARAYVRDIFGRTCLTGTQATNNILKAGKGILEDPAMKMAQDGREHRTALIMEMDKWNSMIHYNENLLTQAFLEMEMEQPHYSDANFSMRLSYGIIQDYTAGTQHYNYFTDMQSLLDKAARQEETEDYELEESIIQLLSKGKFGRYADKRTGKMQLCFLSNNDITGGNSGSPMFNGKGELIGLAFDGNWEAMSGDISFNPTLQRCIGVDIRFVLYLIDKWGKAKHLIKEMGL